jgi:hypothetical protein
MATESMQVSKSPKHRQSKLAQRYEQDYHAWLTLQAHALREGRLHDIDAPNLAEELEDMARSAKKAVKNQLVRLLAHLLKWSIQKNFRTRNPSAANRWRASIRNARDEIKDDLGESPSLNSYLPAVFAKAYQGAVNNAVEDTGLPFSVFPQQCPWPLDDVLNDDFLPE